jgi:hypothetical protein
MNKTQEQIEDADIKAAISAVAAYSALKHKRELIQRMVEEIEPIVTQARLNGDSIDTSDIFLRLAEKYAN